MIRIGLNDIEKCSVIHEYVKQHGIRVVYVFAPDKYAFYCDLSDVEVVYVRYDDIIMYETFYRLLEKIDNSALLVFNECMRTQNRSDLTYNCAHHYCNQTTHVIVFEFFPFIDDESNFMILLDFVDKGKYKSKSFTDTVLSDEDILAKRYNFTLDIIESVGYNNLFGVSAIQSEYEAQKEQLFNNLGMSNPATIPKKLHIFVGKYKRTTIDTHLKYVARNKRFNLPHVVTYKNVEQRDYIVLDFPHRRIDFNDFLKHTGMVNIKFVSSGTKVDSYYASELASWLDRLGLFYDKANIY